MNILRAAVLSRTETLIDRHSSCDFVMIIIDSVSGFGA